MNMLEELNFKNEKSFRLIKMYEKLNKGEVLYKKELANMFCVSEKTLLRDISDLRVYYANTSMKLESIVYDKKINGYYLKDNDSHWMTNQEILAICKVILESRAFNLKELKILIDKLLLLASPINNEEIRGIINKELFYYVPLKHNQNLLQRLWNITLFINHKEFIEIAYTRKDGVTKNHEIKPVALMFSEFYFYIIAYMADESKKDPTVFRVDRIKEIRGTNKHFRTPYSEEFNDGEFRKRVQFMFTGKLQKVKFEFSGASVESILDKLPTAEIINEKDGIYTMVAESYGEGIYMWLRAQGDIVKVIE